MTAAAKAGEQPVVRACLYTSGNQLRPTRRGIPGLPLFCLEMTAVAATVEEHPTLPFPHLSCR